MAYIDELLKKAKTKGAAEPTPRRVPESPAAAPVPPSPMQRPAPPAEREERKAERLLVESYGSVKVFKSPGEALYYYDVPAPRLMGEEKQLIDSLVNIAAKVIEPMPFVTEAARRRAYFEKVLEIMDSSPELRIPPAAHEFYAEAAVREMIGYGPIDPLLADDLLEEIMVVGPGKPVYVFHRKYDMMKTNIVFYDDEDIRDLIDRIARGIGRRIDFQSPLLDARLPDGTRVTATIPPASIDGSTLTIRKFRRDPLTLVDLINFGTINYELAALLWMASDGLGARPANIIVAGGAAAGKCMTAETRIQLANGEVAHIGDLVEEKLRSGSSVDGAGWESAPGDGSEVLSLDPTTMRVIPRKVSAFWRHAAPKKLVRVRVAGGKEITVTPEHPFFALSSEGPRWVRADELTVRQRVAVPVRAPVTGERINFLHEVLNNGRDLYVVGQGAKVCEWLQRLSRARGKSLPALAKELGWNELTVRAWKGANAIPLRAFVRLAELAGEDLQSLNELTVKTKTSPKTVRVPKHLEPAHLRWLGLLIGDGHVEPKYVELHNANQELLREFLALSESCWGTGGVIEHPKDRTTRARVMSSAVVEMARLLGVPEGEKAGTVALPNLLMRAPNGHLRALLSGLFDTDGCVAPGGHRAVEFSTKSRSLAEQVSAILLRLGVVSSLTAKRGHSYVNIYGGQACARFGEQVLLKNPHKGERLRRIVTEPNARGWRQRSTLRGFGDAVRSLRESRGMGVPEFARQTGLSARFLRQAERNERGLSTQSVQKIATSLGRSVPFTEAALTGDAEFHEVQAVEVLENHAHRYVYDLTVDGTHTFLAGSGGFLVAHNTTTLNVLCSLVAPSERIITIEEIAELQLPIDHWIRLEARPPGIEETGEITLDELAKNALHMRPDRIIVGEIRGSEGYTLFSAMNVGHTGSMGTVHANSAHESIIRLTSPPINVPPRMLAPLNLILMQQRISDRRKGLIRRITEVAELVAVSEDKPELQILYQWDPAKDVFRPTGLESNYLQILGRFTGLNKEGLQEELKRRAQVLKELNERGLRSLTELSKVVHDYALKYRGRV